MINLLIFGTGRSCEKILQSLKLENVNIVSFIDNDIKKINHYYKNSSILIRCATDIKKLDFDFILIASIYPEIISEQLDKLGVNTNKIIKYYSMNKMDVVKYKDLFHIELVLYDLMESRLDKEIRRIECDFYNFPYEMYDKIQKNNIKLPKIKSMKNSMEELVKNNYSLSRFGDGEFMLMFGRSINFQSYNEKLAHRLDEVIQSKTDSCMIAITDIFGELDYFIKSKSRDDIRILMASGVRELIFAKLDLNIEYGNALVTRPYMFLNTRSDAEFYFNSFISLWKDKEVLIVEGERTYFGIGNDLLDNAKKCERIIAPSINAFSSYENIYCKTLEWLSNKKKDNCIVLAALGPTATILAYDVSQLGYRIIDIGHLDLEYEWYKRKLDEASVIKYKYCDNIIGGSNPEKLTNEIYDKQVIASFV